MLQGNLEDFLVMGVKQTYREDIVKTKHFVTLSSKEDELGLTEY
jgi:hypothetical protein